jgi:mono/diheme cytochrome c family protein
MAASAAGAQVPDLPDGPGKALVLSHCVDCHGVDQIAAKRQDEAAWRGTVGRMVGYGAALTPAESEAVVKYLAASFGPDAAKPAAPPSPASSGRR